MRSLTILSSHAQIVKGKKPEARYTGLAVRPEQTFDTTNDESLYLAAERQLPDGGVEIQIFLANSASGRYTSPLASFQAPPEPPFSLPDGKHVVSFRYLAEANALVVILAGGDIVVISLEEELSPDQEKVEVVGSVESGIKAADWSPDEELLVLVTGEDNLVEMTKSFDVLTELPLKTAEFGEEKPVDVGWGAQSTQFHGSIGKTGRDAVAGLPAATQLAALVASSSSPAIPEAEDTTYRISWRGDGAFFAVSTLFDRPLSTAERRIRFYSRTAVLQSTSEPTPFLEGGLAWQPSGSIIASTANNSSEVVFFERNGLRRYEFALKEERPEFGSRVRQLSWNTDSSVLAVWIERRALGNDDRRSSHVVQLWRRNNYHWYLKQSIRPHLSNHGTLERIYWNAEHPLALYFVSSDGWQRQSLTWNTFASRRSLPNDSGAVAVVDGSKLLLTPFRYQNIPPPMSSLVLADPQDQTPIHIAFADNDDVIAALMPDGAINIWSCTFSRGNRSEVLHKGRLSFTSERSNFRQLAISTRPNSSTTSACQFTIWLLADDHSKSAKRLRTSSEEGELQILEEKDLPLLDTTAQSIRTLGSNAFVQSMQGGISSVGDNSVSAVAAFREFCPDWAPLSDSSFVGLSEAGRLYVNSRLLASSVSSFALGGEFLVYTTLQHEARFVLVEHLDPKSEETLQESDMFSQPVRQDRADEHQKADKEAPYGRRVERGARIVTVVPSSMSVVLQMPRGNLETISPRPLVLQVVRRHLDSKAYREAFLICRRHRIDLNFLCDHNPQAFDEDLTLFVDQIGDIDHLNLFVTGLKNVNVTRTIYRSLTRQAYEVIEYPDISSKTSDICTKLRAVLEAKDLQIYANTILTTYICQQPADLESALRLITRLKVLKREAAEDAVKYIIFLADSNQLYDIALGMYDFELVLAVAQNSQRDPKEYIPFLRELRGYDKYYQRFKIDDHLRKYKQALHNLSLAGEEHHQAVIDYMHLHELYDTAVEAYSDRALDLRKILDLRGDWLMKDDRCHEAALSYTLAREPRKAMIAHQKALTWQELFDIAMTQQLNAQEIGQLAQNVASALRTKGRHAEAGRVLVEYGRDVKEAVVVLSEGNEFSEAVRIASLYATTGLLSSIIIPALLEAVERLTEEADEIREQVEKQVARLAVLREKRISDSANFYGDLLPQDADDALDNVDVQTDAASTVATTQFTRYTAAPVSTRAGTVKTGRSRATSKQTKKALKKAITGAKGSIYEESYLLGSLSRLVVDGGRIAVLIAAAASASRVLVRLSVNEAAQPDSHEAVDFLVTARRLETAVARAVDFAKESIDGVWTALGDTKLHDLETALLADADPRAAADLEVLKRPEKPKFATLGHWKIEVVSLLRV